MPVSSKSRRSAPKRAKRPTLAQQADIHDLYERAVQDPQTDAATLARFYRRFRKASPKTMREDFCGTAALSVAWVRANKDRKAIGVDLDAPTLAWGKARYLEDAPAHVVRRVKLYEANVLDGVGARSDVVCALNFSYQVFKQRADLLRYFQVARGRVAPKGIFVLDVLGGLDAMMEEETERDQDGFVYRWEQERFDALTHAFLAHIHFEFSDGSAIERAFTYDWRLYTVPELTDLLLEAGFSKVHRLWERTDDDGEGNGSYYEPKHVENQESWWTYLVAER
jgi:SAM-dependent methyltransferase